MARKSSKAIFHIFDEMLFKQTSQMKASPAFQSYVDKFNRLDDKEKKLITYVGNALLVIIPLILCLNFYLSNNRLQDKVQMKKDLLTNFLEFKSKSDGLKNAAINILASVPIEGEEDLLRRLKVIVSQHSIPDSKIRIEDFSKNSKNNNLVYVTANVLFKDLSNNNFNSVLLSLYQKEKMIVSTLKVSKSKNKLLNGSIGIIHMGQVGE
jgi:hypothetical protein